MVITLTPEQKKNQFNKYKKFLKIILIDATKVGWVTIVPQQSSINIGFGLFKEQRGQGLMSRILQSILPKIHESHPGQTLTAETRTKNLAAIKSLQQCGFVENGIVTRPPCGTYKEPIEYLSFVYANKPSQI